ncbi:MAG: uroporphyrinogen decarboxylase [Candidatus Xenolissoclinum pacificiensis L6]|uniref:Uroporphyrinogen decarboxylase n=1 Tax=Candidatus Xenolissoclinum pacificiensis L6 TaxID=1401685 RepID=W2V080_9RICK|nr:MAG: uroporphyrinogen decarboxylase [Candidatus Xenolissoclinum pacificiensis L6]
MKFFDKNKKPIWFMRQAGRYMKEYNNINLSFLEKCYTPEIACEITLQPIKKFDFDAAILFSDILVLLDALGYEVIFKKNYGPIINAKKIILENYDMERFHQKTNFVIDAILHIKQFLSEDKVLIGFAGSPFTLSCFLIEGSNINPFKMFKVHEYLYSRTEEYSKIINIFIENTIIYLQKQINAGIKVLQLFDSFSGVLSEQLYKKWVIEPTFKIINNLKGDIQVIGFPKFSGLLYEDYVKNTNINIISIDSCMSLKWVKNNLQKYCYIQGNLDPYLLCYGSKNMIKERIQHIHDNLCSEPFIFNLGHGVLKNTKEENVLYAVDFFKSIR